MRAKVSVVGAGIAGLAAGFRLQQAGCEVQLYEAADYAGGRMKTVRKDGYILDTGASVLSGRYERLLALVADLGISDQIVEGNDLVGILRDGVIHRMHGKSSIDMLTTRLVSTRAKLAALKLLLDARRVGARLEPGDMSGTAGLDGETAEAYARRRLGDEATDWLVDPMVRAIFQGRSDQLSSIELFSIVRNFFGGAMLNSRSGIDFLAQELARRVPVLLSSRVTSVEEGPNGVKAVVQRNGGAERTEEADACIIALTAREMVRVYPQLGLERHEIIDGLQYTTLWTTEIGLERAPAEPCVFIQVPRREHPHMTAVVLEHNKLPGRAPAGKGLLNSYWLTEWYEQHWDDDDAKVVDLTLAGITKVLPGIDNQVGMTHVTRWQPGVLLATPGIWSAMARFHAVTPRDTRVLFAGDYLGGSTTNSALASGENAAARIVARLGLRS